MASPFSGSAGRNAAIWQAGFLQDQQDNIDKRIAQGQKSSLKDLGTGYTRAAASYNDAIDLYDPYAATGLAAFNQYADASGVNGQEGHDRAVDNFRAGPGYEWAVDQATEAVARKSSAIGALGSGNTMAAISDRAGHMADQEYDDYLSRLDGIGKVGFSATGAQAGLTRGIGDLGYNYGQDRANIRMTGTGLGVQSQSDFAKGVSEAGQKGMLAGQEAAASRMNFGLGLGGSLLSLAGLGTGGGSTLGGSLLKRLGMGA